MSEDAQAPSGGQPDRAPEAAAGESPAGQGEEVSSPEAGGSAAARRRRGARGGRRRRKAVDASAPAAATAAKPPAADGPDAAEESSPAGPEPGPAELAAPRHRHRGSRGGRRRHKAVDAEHAEVVREAEEAAGEAAPPAVAAEAPVLLSGAVDETSAEPATSPGRTAAKRRRKPRTAVARPASAPNISPADDALPEEVAEAAPEAGAAVPGEEPVPAKRRRRGGRGGRGRRAAGDEGAAAPAEGGLGVSAPAAETGVAEAGAAETPPTVPLPAAPARGGRARGREHRRPAAIVRQDEGSGLGTAVTVPSARGLGVVADQPERKIILVTDDDQELRVALVEDARLAEIYVERPEKKSYLGDIYQGKVENVLGGIDAAFVDFGLEKNGFLYVDEVTAPEGEKRARRIGDALKNGQQVLVQVTKDPMGSKGARLSTKISLAGRYLVYVPGGSGVGVSRRLGQAERDRLRDISRELKPKNAGLIVRTIAEGHGLDDLKRDLRYLSRLWARLSKKAETVKAPGLVHSEVDISIEVARDMFNDTCESLIVDDPKRHKAIVAFLDKEAPELLPKVHLHDGSEPLFEAYHIEEQIAQALERRVPLPSGGNLVIDHAEALTVIDVNTGRFTRGKGLEDTITKTNLEAAREVVRQLRLRDIGGIIIIDFIDMAHAKNREMVLATLEAKLETDRTKTYVVELSPLGLVEMTRQNTTDGARGILTRTCPMCLGKARVLSEQTMALNVERRVRALARKSQAKAWLIEVCGGVAERLNGERLKRLEKQTGRRVFLEGSAGLPVDTFHVLTEGSVAHVQEQRIPVREGQEVEVELKFSLTYSPRDAVGYVDGYMVIVEGGRPFVGQRRKVRITAIARTGGQATALK